MSKGNRGYQCAQSGLLYEKVVFNTISTLMYKDHKFTSQIEEDLGKKDDIDLICNHKDHPMVGIEIKKKDTPDWMQCSLKYDVIEKKWEGSKNGRIPVSAREVFNKLLADSVIFNHQVPLFMQKNIRHDEWLSIKQNTSDFRDVYIDIPDTTIRDVYRQKGCYYIQVSKKGLYHLGDDIYGFNVPEFIIDQQIRVRTKIHKRINKEGYCDMSVMAACQPKNINLLDASKYSLDNYRRLPKVLVARN